MTRGRAGVGTALGEVMVVWGMLGLDAAAIYRLYARKSTPLGIPERPVGRARAARQLLVFGRHPALPLAIATVPVAVERLAARERVPVAGGAVLLGGVVGAGVTRVGRGSIGATAGDAVAVAGGVGAMALTLGAAWRSGHGTVGLSAGGDEAGRTDRMRLVLGAGLVANGLPWILADIGVYVGDVPPLGRVFLSRQAPPSGGWPAVHLGHHHGMDGTLLAVGALVLAGALPEVRRAAVREALSAYLAFLLVYGTMRAAEDGWNEQVVKRGWTSRKIPLVVAAGRPVRRWVWAGMLGVAGVVHRGWGR